MRAYKHPDNVGHKSTDTTQLEIAAVKHIYVDKAEQGYNEEYLSALTHKLLVWEEEGIVQTPSRAIAKITVIRLVCTGALGPYFD